jgi:hypothetical protein
MGSLQGVTGIIRQGNVSGGYAAGLSSRTFNISINEEHAVFDGLQRLIISLKTPLLIRKSLPS